MHAPQRHWRHSVNSHSSDRPTASAGSGISAGWCKFGNYMWQLNVANAQPPSTASAATDSQSAQPEQESAFQLLHSVMATVASSNEAVVAPEHAPVLHMIGAVMAPVVQMLKYEQQKERAMHRAFMDQLLQQNKQLSQQLDRVEQKIDSNAHFYP
jgi:hypothetical protein